MQTSFRVIFLLLCLISGARGQSLYNVKTFGAHGDGRVVMDAMLVKGSPIVTSAAAQFTPSDIGKQVGILGGASVGGVNKLNPLLSKIVDVKSATTAILSLPAAATVSAKELTVGSDDTAAIQSAVNAASAAGGGDVYLPSGTYITTGKLIWRSNVSMHGDGADKSIIKLMANNACISVVEQLSGATLYDCHFNDFQIDCHLTNGSYCVFSKCFYIRPMVRPVFENLFLHDSIATGIGCDFLTDAKIVGCTIDHCGYGNNGNQPGGAGIGIGTHAADEGGTIANNFVSNCGRFGIFLENQDGSLTPAQHYVITGNHCEGTLQGPGICDAGGATTLISRNVCSGNSTAGIALSTGSFDTNQPGKRDVITDNICTNNKGSGILVDFSGKGVKSADLAYAGESIYDNTCSGNAAYGVQIIGHPSLPTSNISVKTNSLQKNAQGAVITTGNLPGLQISGNTGSD